MRPSDAALRALARRDPVLGRAMRHVPRCPDLRTAGRRSPTHFQALATTILYQQLAGKAAATIHGRVCALSPGADFPRAEALLELPEQALRGAGVSRAKTLALRDLAARVADGRLQLRSVGRLSDERVVERLVQVRGIGTWSAQMFLMFRLGRLDVMPSTDLGVQEGARLLDGLTTRPTPGRLTERAEPWKPLRSVAAWVLWRLVERDRTS